MIDFFFFFHICIPLTSLHRYNNTDIEAKAKFG